MPGATRYIPKTVLPILAGFLFTTLPFVLPPAYGEPTLLASYRSPEIDDGYFANTAQMSPDGEWLAYWEATGEETMELRLRNLKTGSVRKLRRHPLSDSGGAIVWSPDSRAFAVATSRGIAEINQRGGVIAWIDKRKGSEATTEEINTRCFAWSPTGHRFAAFGAYGDGAIWTGGVTRKMSNWMQATRSPNYASDRAWQCLWSPDGKHLLLRYYGLSGERSFFHSLHMAALDTRTGKTLSWAGEGGPPAWIDNHQFLYRSDYFYLAPSPLVLVNPITRQETLWKNDVAAYAVSKDRKTVYAIDTHGGVYTSPTSHRRWKQIYRLNAIYPKGHYAEWTLAAAPNGFVACLGSEVKDKMHYTLTAWRSGKVVDRYSTPETIKLIGWSPARKAFILSSADNTRSAIRAFGAMR